MAVDERLIGALHVQRLDAGGAHPGHQPHQIFQASSFAALLEGNYDGEVSLAELAAEGDLGLGTLNGVDGELIVVDGRFLRADADGQVTEVEESRKTPFAVVTFLEARHGFELGAVDQSGLFEQIDGLVGHPEVVHALRLDGRFERIHARSVPRQYPPYPPLTEVAASQRVFDLTDVEGTMVGFRFPDYAAGLNVPGYHLHFVDASRTRGGHVLDFRAERASVIVDDEVEVHLEAPAGFDIDAPASAEALQRVEHDG